MAVRNSLSGVFSTLILRVIYTFQKARKTLEVALPSVLCETLSSSSTRKKQKNPALVHQPIPPGLLGARNAIFGCSLFPLCK